MIWAIFLVTGYSSFSIKEFLNVIFPFFNIGGEFTSCYLSIASLVIFWLSVIVFAYLERVIGRNGLVYFEVADSNKILALITSVCLFMLFKNLNIKQNIDILRRVTLEKVFLEKIDRIKLSK